MLLYSLRQSAYDNLMASNHLYIQYMEHIAEIFQINYSVSLYDPRKNEVKKKTEI
jgi:hypothetical protein